MATRCAAKTSAFTLIELLVVLAIIGVLVAIGVPVYGRIVETGRAAKCVSNLRQLGSALGLYLGEHNMTMPTLLAGRSDLESGRRRTSTTRSTPTPRAAPAVFACPSDRRSGRKARARAIIGIVALNGQSMSGLNFFTRSTIPDAGSSIITDKAAYHPYLDDQGQPASTPMVTWQKTSASTSNFAAVADRAVQTVRARQS